MRKIVTVTLYSDYTENDDKNQHTLALERVRDDIKTFSLNRARTFLLGSIKVSSSIHSPLVQKSTLDIALEAADGLLTDKGLSTEETLEQLRALQDEVNQIVEGFGLGDEA